MKIIKNKRSVQTSSKLQKNKFSIKASKLAKNRKIIKASSESYSMSDYDIVMYRNTEKVYSGSVYDSKFDNIIEALCKDTENIKVFREWLLDYGLSDFEDIDVSGLVVDMIISEWEEATNDTDDFYIEISMYGHKHSDVRFEVFYAKDEVTASTSTNSKRDVEYLNALAEGVTNNLNDYWGNVTQITYEISDSAITFSNESDVVYIQPIDQIEPNWDDLDADIEELETSIQSELLPKF